jgi:hypothetical protein
VPTVIKVKPDTLDADTVRFSPAPLAQPLFLNSIPKSGSHLLRNILRMFVPLDQQYREDFIQWPNLPKHLVAFSAGRNFMSYGHLFFTDVPAIELSAVRKVQLYRDPYDWVLARARFHLSDEFQGELEHLKDGRISVDDLISLMIFGVRNLLPSLSDMYELNVVAWLASDVFPVRYEDLVRQVRDLDSAEADDYFGALFSACGIDPVPDDWRERVKVGADRRQSGTARENLSGVRRALPESLSIKHRQQVDFIAPGLREILGYAGNSGLQS